MLVRPVPLLSLLLCAAQGASACALSAQPHPQAVVGLQLVFADSAESWAWADALQVSWLRLELRWDWLQPFEDGDFDWSYFDRLVAQARARPGTRILLLFNHAPAWAWAEPARFAARSAQAIRAVVQRHRFDAYEWFNEPNLPGYGWGAVAGGAQASARRYAESLTAGAKAIRQEDAKGFVISAGLSPSNDPESYLRWIVRLTPPDCYDAVGLHPYGQQGRFAAIQANLALLLRQEARPPKPAWFTEYGTDGDAERGALLRHLFEERHAAPITFLFAERDLNAWTRFGLRTTGGRAKPDFALFQALNAPAAR